MLFICLFMMFKGKKVVANANAAAKLSAELAQTPALTRQVASVGVTQ